MAQVSLSGLLEKIASPLRAVGALTRLNSTSPGRPSPEALPPPPLGFPEDAFERSTAVSTAG